MFVFISHVRMSSEIKEILFVTLTCECENYRKTIKFLKKLLTNDNFCANIYLIKIKEISLWKQKTKLSEQQKCVTK